MRPFRASAAFSSPSSRIFLRSLHTTRPHVSRIPWLSPQQRIAGRRCYQRQSGWQDDPAPVQVYRPFLTWKRVGYAVFCGFTSYAIFNFVLSRLAGALDVDLDEAENEQHAGHGTDEDDAIFIACGWPTQLPRTFYKQSDPEWQEFMKISRDEERGNAAREELARITLEKVAATPMMRKILGPDIVLGTYWLDLKFPDRPPPEYSRYGIEITDEYIAWAIQTIPHSHYVKLRHIMYPQAMFSAAKNSLSVYAQLQRLNLKTALGMELNKWDQQLLKVRKLERGLHGLDGSSSGQAPTQPPVPSAAQTDPPSSAAAHPFLSLILPTSSAPAPGEDVSANQSAVMSLLRPSSDMSLAWRTFLATLQMNWETYQQDTQPPGAFYIVGQVEIGGDRGKVRCDVEAAYDPKKSEIVFSSCKTRYYWEASQRPRGGP